MVFFPIVNYDATSFWLPICVMKLLFDFHVILQASMYYGWWSDKFTIQMWKMSQTWTLDYDQVWERFSLTSTLTTHGFRRCLQWMVEYMARCTHLQACPLIRKQWCNSTHDLQLQLATLCHFLWPTQVHICFVFVPGNRERISWDWK
jgi:hypothetical protein